MKSSLDLSVVNGGCTSENYAELLPRKVRREHRDSVMVLLKKPAPLTGREVRLLRERMRLDHRRLGEVLSYSAAALVEWEAGEAILPAVEVRFRLLCADHISVTLNIRTVLCSLVREHRRRGEQQSTGRFPVQSPAFAASR